MENNCIACKKIENKEGIFKEYQFWTLEHYTSPAPVAGWLILRLKNHSEGLEGMDSEASKELGNILDKLPKAIKMATGAKTVYLCSFNEAAPHLHFHLIPRYNEETRRTTDFFAMQGDVKEGKIPAADEAKIKEIINSIK